MDQYVIPPYIQELRNQQRFCTSLAYAQERDVDIIYITVTLAALLQVPCEQSGSGLNGKPVHPCQDNSGAAPATVSESMTGYYATVLKHGKATGQDIKKYHSQARRPTCR